MERHRIYFRKSFSVWEGKPVIIIDIMRANQPKNTKHKYVLIANALDTFDDVLHGANIPNPFWRILNPK